MERKVEHLAQILFEAKGGDGSVFDSPSIAASNSVFDAGLAWYTLSPKDDYLKR